jgi:hypothetical protein
MTAFVVSDGVYSKKTNGIWLILNPDRGSYLELDDVASFIWSKLQKPVSPEAIAQAIVVEYDIDYETALHDVEDFIQVHLKKKLLKKSS